VLLLRAKWEREFLAVVAAGHLDEARLILDKRTPSPRERKVAMIRLISFRQRLAGLAVLGECEAIERELGTHEGGVAYLAQCEIFGLAALIARVLAKMAAGADPAAAESIVELGQKVPAESPLVKAVFYRLLVAASEAAGGQSHTYREKHGSITTALEPP